MKLPYIKASLTSAILGLALILSASATDSMAASPKWWERHDEGWFFYNEKSAPAEPEEIPDTPVPPPKEEPPLATDIIKKEGDRLLSEALVNPTEENVVKYMRYQKESLDMSTRLAYIWQRMLMKYPDLYMDTGTTKVHHEIKESVDRLAQKAGLFFIYSAGSEVCQQAARVVADFQSAHPSFIVVPVTIDRPLPLLADNTKPDNGITSQLGVKSVPAWYLAYPDENRFEHIGTGALTLSDLERRLYHYGIAEEGMYSYSAYDLADNPDSNGESE